MQRFVSRARTVRAIRERHGLNGVAYLVAQRLQQAVKPHAHVEWFVFMETHPARTFPGEPPVWVRAGDPLAAELTAFGLSHAEIETRLGRGSCAVYVGDDGTGVYAYVWVHDLPTYDEEGIHFTPGAGDVWMYDAEVRPDRRGQRVFARLYGGAARDLETHRGRPVRLVATIDAINTSSLRAFENWGGERVGTYLLLKLGPLRVLREAVGGGVRWRARLRPFVLPAPSGRPPPDRAPEASLGTSSARGSVAAEEPATEQAHEEPPRQGARDGREDDHPDQ